MQTIGVNIRKNYHQLRRTQRFHVRNTILNNLNLFQEQFLNIYGLKFNSIVIRNINTENDNIDKFEFEITNYESTQAQQTSGKAWLKRVIYVKDKNNISDRTYKSLRFYLGLRLPSFYVLKKEIRLYDQSLDIYSNS